MKTSNIVILIAIATMMVMVLMAGCKEKPAEPNDPNVVGYVGITLESFFTPIEEVALFDFSESVANPFTFSIDGVGRQFTHEEFKRRLGFVEPNEAAEPNLPYIYENPYLSTNIVGQTQTVCSKHGRLAWGSTCGLNDKRYCSACVGEVAITYLDKHLKGIE